MIMYKQPLTPHDVRRLPIMKKEGGRRKKIRKSVFPEVVGVRLIWGSASTVATSICGQKWRRTVGP